LVKKREKRYGERIYMKRKAVLGVFKTRNSEADKGN
jgi:hypothetical protein